MLYSEIIAACSQIHTKHINADLLKVKLVFRDKWVPVTTAWRVLRFRMEKRPPIWGVAANILNKQSLTADKVWSSSLGVGRGDKSSPRKLDLQRNMNTCLGPGLILWYDLSKEKGTWELLRWIFRKWDVEVWTRSSWLRIGTSGGLLWTR